MQDKSLALGSIGQIAITCKDLDAATAFYRDVLGMQFLFSAPGMSFFDCGSIRLMLGTAEREELDHPASILYYKVDDIESACATLKDRGVRFDRDPAKVHAAEDHDLWLAFFRDGENNLLALMSEVPR